MSAILHLILHSVPKNARILAQRVGFEPIRVGDLLKVENTQLYCAFAMSRLWLTDKLFVYSLDKC